MKKSAIKLFAVTLLMFLFIWDGISQCNTNTTVCQNSNVAGPFTFAPADANPSSCLAYTNGAAAPNYAYVTLYITQGGALNLLINGDQTTGCLDVAIFDITGTNDPCNSLSTANEISCNFATDCDGCAEFAQATTTFPGCESEVTAPNVNAGDVLLILVEDYTNNQNSFTLELSNTAGSAQTGLPDATIDPVAPICEDAASIQLNAVDNGGTWSGPGVSAGGLFDPSLAGIGTHTINYTIGTNPCDAQDAITIDVINCNTCLITNFTVNANLGICENVWEITGTVEYETPPASGDLIFEDCNGNQTIIASATFADPGTINFTHTGPLATLSGGNCTFSVYFSAEPTCSATVTANLPGYTPPDEAGTVTPNLVGSGTNNFILCDQDVLNVNSDDNWNIPPIAPGNDPGLIYFVYVCPPTPGGPGVDPALDPCLVGFFGSEDISLLNNGGDADPLLTSIGLTAGDEVYLVPMTLGSLSAGEYQADCYDLAIDQMTTVIYLNPITTNIVEDCQAGTATVTINGGMPEYNGTNFTISNLQPASASLSTTSVADGGSVVISGLVDGDNYSFDIVDGNGCPQTISGTFVGLEDPSFTYPNNTYCNSDPDPTATVTGTPGGTFTATPAGLTIDANSGLIDLSSASGAFTITYTTPDPVCFDQQTFAITINAKPSINPMVNQTVCDQYVLPAITGTDLTGNEAYYTGTGGTGISYPAGTTLNYADFATYPVQLYIYDETGTVPNCFDETSFELTINPTPVIDPIADQINCDSYTLPPITGTNLTGSESYFTATNGGGTVLSPGSVITTQGVNTVYIYDQTATTPNCTDEEIFTVTINLTPDISPLADQTVCDSYTLPAITGTDLTGAEAYYDATNGGGVQYNAGDIITTPGVTTFYLFDETATVPNCFDEEIFNLTINVTPTFTVSYTDPTQCGVADGTITLSGLNPNTGYNVVYSDGGTVQAASLMTSDGAGDILISGLSAGSYSDFEVTLNGCTGVDNSNLALSDPNSPSVDAGNDQEVCEGTAVTLTALNPDGAGITWSNGVNDGVAFTPAVGSITYTVTADLLNCISTDQVIVTVHPNPNVSAGNDILICEGETVTLTGSGADTYIWDNNVTNGSPFSPTSTQVYTVIGTTTEGCQGTDNVEITVEPLPEVSFTADSLEGCYPVTTTFTNTSNIPGTSCNWNFGDGSVGSGCDEITHTFNDEGCFDINLEITSANGCTNDATESDYICISGYPTADFNYSPSELTTMNTEVDFENNSINANSYFWDFGDGESSTSTNPTHSFPVIEDTFLVELIAVNAAGCTDTAYSTVQIFEELIFYVPNTFTPDEDSFNEEFKPIFTSGFDIYSYKLLIFNRWGEIVFESNDSDVGWKGTYGAESSELVKEGTYVWKIFFKTKISDERKVEIGHVNVLK